jgi:hypothetical protein
MIRLRSFSAAPLSRFAITTASVMQLEVTAGEGFERDAIGRIQVAIGGKIGSP